MGQPIATTPTPTTTTHNYHNYPQQSRLQATRFFGTMSVNDHDEWRRQREEEERRRFVAMFDPRNYHPVAGRAEGGRPPVHDAKAEEARRKRVVRDHDGT